MGIGVGIVLIALGAILAFAVDAEVSGIDVQTIGVILVIVGVLGIVLDLVLFAPRRRRVVTRDEAVQQPVAQQPVQPVVQQPVQPVQQQPPPPPETR